uniref:Uncharacterized protein n=1 Tax=Timema bartmani TaxID=61472 RepID=A0A7R9I460_9NEOP|nr:unnamed protein product [Timema bartmani]
MHHMPINSVIQLARNRKFARTLSYINTQDDAISHNGEESTKHPSSQISCESEDPMKMVHRSGNAMEMTGTTNNELYGFVLDTPVLEALGVQPGNTLDRQ